MSDIDSIFLAYTGKYSTAAQRREAWGLSSRALEIRLSLRPDFKDSPVYRAHGPHYEKEVEYFGIGLDTPVAEWAIRFGIIDNLDRIEFARELLFMLEIWPCQNVIQRGEYVIDVDDSDSSSPTYE